MNNNLDRLFAKAREEDPVVSFEETQERFSSTIAECFSSFGNSQIWNIKIFKFYIILFAVLTLVGVSIFNTKKSEGEKISPILSSSSIGKIMTDTLSTEENLENSLLEHKIDTNIIRLFPTSSPKPSKGRKPDLFGTNLKDTIIPLKTPIKAEIIIDSFLNREDSSYEERQISSGNLTQKPIINRDQENLIPVEFTVNESTTTRELASISSHARKAGIDYTYVVDLKKKLIREFNVEMLIKGKEESSSIQVSVLPKQKFEITFGWIMNEEGKAVKLSDDVKIAEAESKHPLVLSLARSFYESYQTKGIHFITKQFNQLTKNVKSKSAKANILNRTGYLFLNEGGYAQAIEIFELNAKLFPRNPNVWDSLGEGYYKNGEKEKALEAFRKALALDPNFSSSQKWIEKIISE